MSFIRSLSRPLRALNPFGALPEPSGSFTVGSHDVEWTPEGFKLGNTLSQEHHPHTVLARLYYPADPSKSHHHLRDKWLPDYDYAKGYTDFVGISPYLTPLLAAPLLSLTIPSYADIPLHPSASSFPVILFSHGLAGCRTTYSHICTHFASQGFVVVAVEHRDGSASFTMSKRPQYDEEGNELPMKNYPYENWKKRNQDAEDLHLWRRGQLSHRVNEVEWAWRLINEANLGSGHSLENFMESKGGFSLTNLKGRLDMSRVIMVGHSFGAATALSAMDRLPKGTFRAGITLDPWMFPYNKGDETPASVPLMIINSGAWYRWEENYIGVKQYVSRRLSKNNYDTIVHVSIKETGHQSASDFPVIMGKFGKIASYGSREIEAQMALDVQGLLMDGFLRTYLGHSGDDVSQWIGRNIDMGREEMVRGRVGLVGEHNVIWHYAPKDFSA